MRSEASTNQADDNPEAIAGKTITVRVKYFASIREAAGNTEESHDLISGSVVHDLLNKVAILYGDKMRGEIFDGKAVNGLRDDIMITLNEAIINHIKTTETTLDHGDVLALFPIFPGGG